MHSNLVQQHLLNVENLAAKYGEAFGVKNLAALAGILHDMGKFSPTFREYIRNIVFDPANAPKKRKRRPLGQQVENISMTYYK
ncbi:CRISPR-associated endonuclease Cas3'' [Anaerobacillus sp. HL2]|nr:CRISPR-associated endonuclease Cas3'' [Anaerobacillus sp. HL2]